jgi:hypothetical protein
MHTTSSFVRAALVTAACTTLLLATTAHAQLRLPSTRVTTPSSSSSSTTSSSVSSSSSSKTYSVPATSAVTTTTTVSEMPYCGGMKGDSMVIWDGTAKKWACKQLSSLLPPKCDGADQALRFDGTSWKCETIGGLLVAHAAAYQGVDTGKWTCDTKSTWGGATCTSDGAANGKVVIKCPMNTVQIEAGGLSGYSIPAKEGPGVLKFGSDYHVFCLSRVIKIGK